MSVVTILTEDWYSGYTPRDERFVPDFDDELDIEERDDYALVLEDELVQARCDLAWLHRDEADQSILLRWNQPDDVLDELAAIENADERAIWVERMTAFRRTQLHRLLTDYFGTSDYQTKEIVLRWKQDGGRWVPDEKMPVLTWINSKVEERGSQLSGFAACAGTIRSKLARRRVAKTGEAWWKTYNAA